MPTASHRSLSTWLLTGALCATAFALPACSPGHGKATSQFREQSNARMNAFRAATEWDLAMQQFVNGDLPRALEGVDRSIQLNPEIAKSHLLRGRVLLEMERLEDAVAAFDRSFELDFTNAETPYYRAIVYERLGRTDEALADFALACELDAGNAQYVLAQAEVLIDRGERSAARELLYGARTHFEINAGIRQTLAHIALMDGDEAEALKLFEEASLLAPNDPAVLEDLIRTQIKAGRFADAEINLNRILGIANPKAPARRDLMHLHARCLLELKRLPEARQVYTTLTRGSDGAADIEAWIGLGAIAELLDDNVRLRDIASRLLAAAPDRYEGYYLLAIAQHREGKSEDAVRTLDRAIERSRGANAPMRLKTAIYWDLGRKEDARRAVVAALAADPTDEHSRRFLDRLNAGTQ